MTAAEAAAEPLDHAGAAALGPVELRAAIRAGRWRGPTAGLAMGYLQSNLVVLPRGAALEFVVFCLRNAAACPIVDVSDVGATAVPSVAAGADLRTDVPRYRVFHDGEVVAEPADAGEHWRDDAVAFLLGCAMTCDEALLAAGIPLRHLRAGRGAPVYVTSVECTPAGRFAGPLVVNMRPIPAKLVASAVTVSSRYPLAHGAPVHVGDPGALGIRDLDAVDFGQPPLLRPGDVPVFWGCGITPQFAVERARPAYAITHYPGHMFVTDRRAEADASH